MSQSQAFQVDRYCVRERLNEKDADGDERKNSVHRGDPWMIRKMEGPVAAPVESKPSDSADVRQEIGSGGISTDLTRKPPLASPRLISVPDSPPTSAQLPLDPLVGDKGPVLPAFGRNGASPEAPAEDTTNYDQLHELRNYMSCASNGVIIRRIPRRYRGLDWRPWTQRTRKLWMGVRAIWIRQQRFWAKEPEL